MISDQLVGRGHAQQHKGQALEGGILGPIIVHRANGRKKVVGKVQPQGHIDLIDKDDHRLADLFQHHFPQELQQTLIAGR